MSALDATSPCTGLCRLDPGTGWCLGCGRTTDEIGNWPTASDDEKKRIKAGLEARLIQQRGFRPLPE